VKPETLQMWQGIERRIEAELGVGAGWRSLKIIFEECPTGERVPAMATLFRKARNEQIRLHYNDGSNTSELAVEFSVSKRTIRRVVHGDR